MLHSVLVIFSWFFSLNLFAPKIYMLHDKQVSNIDSLISEGNSKMKSEDYLNALYLYTDAIENLKIYTKDTAKMSYCYMRLGLCYNYFEYQKNTKTYLDSALVLFTKLNDKSGEAYTLTYLGDFYEDAGDYIQAKTNHQKALNIFDSIQLKDGLAIVYDNLASLYENFSKYDTSLLYLQKAYQIYDTTKDTIGQSVVLNNFGDIYVKLKNYRKALKSYTASLHLSTIVNSREEIRGNLKDLARLYALMGRYKDAYEYFQLFYKENRKLKIENKIEDISILEASSVSNRKNLEIVTLNAEKEIIRLQSVMTIVLLGAALVILVIAYISYNIKSKKDKELQKFKEKQLERELELRKESLVGFAKALAERSEIIEDLRRKVEKTFDSTKNSNSAHLKAIDQLTNVSILTDDDWKQFKRQFEAVYPGFFTKLKFEFNDLSTGDIRLAAILKLKMTQEEIANMMGVSADSVKKAKSRLKKKINLPEDEKLKDWIEKY